MPDPSGSVISSPLWWLPPPLGVPWLVEAPALPPTTSCVSSFPPDGEKAVLPDWGRQHQRDPISAHRIHREVFRHGHTREYWGCGHRN